MAIKLSIRTTSGPWRLILLYFQINLYPNFFIMKIRKLELVTSVENLDPDVLSKDPGLFAENLRQSRSRLFRDPSKKRTYLSQTMALVIQNHISSFSVEKAY